MTSFIVFILCLSSMPIQQTSTLCVSVEQCPKTSSSTYDCSNYTNEDLNEWKSKYQTMVSVGSVIYPQAAANLQHFLDGSGKLVEMSRDFLLSYSKVTDRISDNIETIICGTPKEGSGIIGRGRNLKDGDSMKEKICYCASTYSTIFTDLYYASGGFTIHTATETCITRNGGKVTFTMSDITHTFYDPYNWEAAKGLKAFVPGFGDVPDSAAYCLEQNNMGKSFVMKTVWKDERDSISGTIDLSSFDCKYTEDDSIDACKSPPWLFVVDTTSSMANDINAVKQTVQRLINERKDTVNEPRLYVLSEFNDPSIGPVTTDVNADSFLTVVNGLSVYGGGDCPEYAMGGILNAIPYADEDSYMFFFTDAAAKDAEKQASVFAQLSTAKVSFVPFISGECSGRRRLLASGNDLYVRLAFETGGFPIFTTHQGVDDVITIVDSLTISDTAALFTMVKENPTMEINITIPIDSDLDKVTFIISSSFNSYPYAHILSTPSTNFNKTTILNTQSLHSVDIMPYDDSSYGDYIIRVGASSSTNFISLSVISQTSLSFALYLSTDIDTTGVVGEMFGGLSNTQSLRITVSPVDSSLINSVDAISIISIDGEKMVNNSDISLGVDGYYAVFHPINYQIVGNAFHILVIGKDVNNYKYYRMINKEILIKDLRLNITSNIDQNIVIGTSLNIPFDVLANDNTTNTVTLTATSDLDEYVTLSVIPTQVSFINSAPATLNVFVNNDITLIGRDLSITLTTINSDTDAYAYLQINFDIIANITDNTPPQCISLNNTYDDDCGTFDANIDDCNSSFWKSIIYVFDTDDNGNTENNYGIDWITTVSEDPYAFTTIWNESSVTFEPGDDELYLLYTSSCCSTYSRFVVYDQIDQISSCQLNTATKCAYDEIFGEAELNETVIIQCSNVKNNSNLNQGTLSRTCMNNGKWSDIVDGQCYVPLTEQPTVQPTSQPTIQTTLQSNGPTDIASRQQHLNLIILMVLSMMCYVFGAI